MPPRTRGRVRPSPLLILFVISGAAALIYEIVWFQMLPLVIGSSFVSLGTVLAAFMGGMGLGSLIAPKFAGVRHPLRVYAALELGIGLCGLAILWGLPLLGALYTGAGGGHVLVRAAIAGVCLVPPAMLMGATLPVACKDVGCLFTKSVKRHPTSFWLGALYTA